MFIFSSGSIRNGKENMSKNLKILLCWVAFLLLVCPSQIKADDPGDAAPNPVGGCRSFFNNGGYLFDDFEHIAYTNGFLEMHFKLKTPYNDGRGWFAKVFMHKADCAAISYASSDTMIGPMPYGMQFYSIRFSDETHYDLWNDESDLKLDCSGCSGDLPPEDYKTVSYSGTLDGGATFFHSGDYYIKGAPPEIASPVLIIPGITGTELLLNAKPVWPDPAQLLINSSDDFMSVLALNNQGAAVNTSVVPGQALANFNYSVGTYHYFDLLISDLDQAGFHQGQNLFLFPYDWRLGVKDLTAQLRQKVTDVLAQTGAKKVNIIAHSYGGLIAKEYSLEGDSVKIDKLIMVGVPNLGSVQAAKTLLFGDNLGIPLLNSEEIRKLAQNMPSIYNLLPSKEYFTHNVGYYDDLSNPTLKTILNYDQTKNFLVGLGKNQGLIDLGEQLHGDAFDNFLSADPSNTFNIVGCARPTLKTINKMYYGQGSVLNRILNQPKYRIETDNGDGTVLLSSSTHLSLPSANNFYAPGVDHSKLLNDAGVRKQILTLLKGGSNNLQSSTANCGVKGKLVSLPSNIELTISNKANGEKLLSGLDYSENKIGDSNFVYLPDGTDYLIDAPAPADNKVDAAIKNYDNSKTTYYDNILVNQKFEIAASSDGDTVKTDDNGLQQAITPTYTEDASGQPSQPTLDLAAPITKLNFKGQQYVSGSIGVNPEDRKINLTATDDLSGISTTKYSTDDGYSWKDYSSEFDLPLDAASIWFYSVDKVGNIEQPNNILLNWDFSNQSPTVVVNNTGTALPSPVSTSPQSNDETEAVAPPDEEDIGAESASAGLEEHDNPEEVLSVASLPTGAAQLQLTVNLPEIKVTLPAPATDSSYGTFSLLRILFHLIFF